MLLLWSLWETCGARNPLHRQEGQGLVEYALIIVLVAIMLVSALFILGGQIATAYGDIKEGLASNT